MEPPFEVREDNKRKTKIADAKRQKLKTINIFKPPLDEMFKFSVTAAQLNEFGLKLADYNALDSLRGRLIIERTWSDTNGLVKRLNEYLLTRPNAIDTNPIARPNISEPMMT